MYQSKLLTLLSIFASIWSISNSSSSSGSSSSDEKQVTGTLTVNGDFCHGANYRFGQRLTDYSNPNLDISDDCRAAWSGFFSPEISLLSGNEVSAPGIDPSQEEIAAILRTNVNAAFPFDWNDILNDAEKEPLGIFNHASYGESSFTVPEQLRVPLASYDDVLNNNLDKWTSYRNNRITDQGNSYTLEDWNKINGNIKLTCFSDGSGELVLTASDAIPYMAYTMWGLYARSEFTFGSGLRFFELNQIGGVPSAFFADKNGNIETQTFNLPFCPLDTFNPIMYVSLLNHWDFALNGGSVQGNRPLSLTGADHLCFVVADHL